MVLNILLTPVSWSWHSLISKVRCLFSFAYLSKLIRYWEFDHVCYTERSWSMLFLVKSLLTFTIPSKLGQTFDFVNILLSEQTYSILTIWSYLPYGANLLDTKNLPAITCLCKPHQFYEFDHVCWSKLTLQNYAFEHI